MSETHFDAVIVGSGFGGSVMAYRLAEAGRRVCVLERGRAYPPGSFPRQPSRVNRNFWDPSGGLYGLFNFWSFDRIEALVSSGLGGGSLIYANVLLRKDERWFIKEDRRTGYYEYWPVTREDLEPHYDTVEKMIGYAKYPLDHPPYSATPKTLALRDAAAQRNLSWKLLNLAVTFANPGTPPVPGEPVVERHPNLHGRTRYTCLLCGECDVGCNYGSKNTLDYNYLTEAQRLGADIRTLHEVRRFEPRREGGYRVHYVQHDLAREGSPFDSRQLPEKALTADNLVLSAGSLGTTYLLLRNISALPDLSPALGTRFSGNGDLLGLTSRGRPREPTLGPVITSTVRVDDRVDGGDGRGYYIQEAGYPVFFAWLLDLAQTPGRLTRALRLGKRWLWRRFIDDYDSDWSAEISSILGGSSSSATFLPLLGMGRDVADGKMFLQGGRLQLDWKPASSRAYFNRVRATMKEIASAWDAQYRDNPGWRYLRRLITTHPLGGCPMGRDPDEGVVNSYGEVFNYPGLYIADGSVMPGPTGTNPALTIAALADRSADRLLQTLRPRSHS